MRSSTSAAALGDAEAIEVGRLRAGPGLVERDLGAEAVQHELNPKQLEPRKDGHPVFYGVLGNARGAAIDAHVTTAVDGLRVQFRPHVLHQCGESCLCRTQPHATHIDVEACEFAGCGSASEAVSGFEYGDGGACRLEGVCCTEPRETGSHDDAIDVLLHSHVLQQSIVRGQSAVL